MALETKVNVNVEFVSPYEAAKIVNAILKEKQIDIVLPPQMFYNYTTARIRAGKKPFIETNKDNKVVVKSLLEWTARYIEKKTK